ncbi:MAG: carbon starvation protein A, partial [Oscillospiraceae bacterium]|nr:carbon starvation protein A [Oscillospiraceae bacterium]
AAVGIIGAGIMGQNTSMAIPAFTSFVDPISSLGNMVPALFITIACGAISGFHSLVGSGTTAKQLDKESDAKPIAYGGMLIECALAIISLCACGFVWEEYVGGMRTPTTVFATGLSKMVATIPGLEATQTTISALLILAVSTFCLTSLDTATRLARYMFQEFWLKPGETYKDVTDFRKTLCNPFVATCITVVIGIGLGLGGYSKIWPLFGAANQLLAALALLAVASWLGNIGKNNKMFLFPMGFMLVMTLWSLCQTIMAKFGVISAGNGDTGAYLQLVLAIILFVLAIVLTVEGVNTIKKPKAAESNK